MGPWEMLNGGADLGLSPRTSVDVCVERLGNHCSETSSLERHDWWKGIGCLSQNGLSLTNWTEKTKRSLQGAVGHILPENVGPVLRMCLTGGGGSGGSHSLMAPSLQRWNNPHSIAFFFFGNSGWRWFARFSPNRWRRIFSCVMHILVLKSQKVFHC